MSGVAGAFARKAPVCPPLSVYILYMGVLRFCLLLAYLCATGCVSAPVAWHRPKPTDLVLELKSDTHTLAQRVAILPACDSCSMRMLSADWFARANSADVFVVYEDTAEARKRFPELLRLDRPVLTYPEVAKLPPQLESLAPSIIELDTEGRLVDVRPL